MACGYVHLNEVTFRYMPLTVVFVRGLMNLENVTSVDDSSSSSEVVSNDAHELTSIVTTTHYFCNQPTYGSHAACGSCGSVYYREPPWHMDRQWSTQQLEAAHMQS